MKTVAITLVIIGALFAALPANAQEEGQTAFTLVGHEDSGFYWTLEGQTAKNPTLVVPAGATITVTVKSAGGFHNLHVEGSPAGDYIETGETTTYTFTAPASGSVGYWCDPHKSSGMAGIVKVAGAATPEAGDNKSPGLGLIGAVLAIAGVALYARRK